MVNPLVSATIRIRSEFQDQGVRQAQGATRDLESHIARAGEAASLLSNRMRTALLVTGAVAAGTVKVFSDVQASQIDLFRITGLNQRAFSGLRQELSDTAVALGLTELETFNLASEAARLGIEGQGIIHFLTTARQASVALNVDVGALGDNLAKMRQALQLSNEDLRRFVGSMIAIDNVSAAAFPSLQEALTIVAPFGQVLGITAQELAAMSSAVIETGISASVTGTALSQLMVSLVKRSNELGEVLGVDAAMMRQIAQDAPLEAILFLASRFTNLVNAGEDVSEQLSAMGLDGRKTVAVMSLLGERTGRVSQLLGVANEEFQRGTLLQRFFGLQAESVQFKLAQLKSSVFAAASEIGRTLAPLVLTAAKAIMAFTEAIREDPVLRYATAFAVVGGIIMSAVGFMTFFVASQVIAFKVALPGLKMMRTRWHEVTASIHASTAATMANAAAMRHLVSLDTLRLLRGAFAFRGGMGATGFLGLQASMGSKAALPLLRIVTILGRIGSIAARAFLPVTLALGLFDALSNNVLGARDALMGLFRPFQQIFGGESQGGLMVIVNLVKILTRLLGTGMAVAIRVLAGALTPIAEVVAGLLKLILRLLNGLNVVLGPVMDFFGLDGGGDGGPGSPPSIGGIAPPSPIGPSPFGSIAPSTGGPRLLGISGVGTLPRPQIRDVSLIVQNPVIRSEEDIDKLRRAWRQDINNLANEVSSA